MDILGDLRADILAYVSPRSAQTETGASQVYGCTAEAVFRLRGEPVTDPRIGWSALVGNGVHAQLAEIRAAVRPGVLCEQRFVFKNVPCTVDYIDPAQHLQVDYKGLALDTPLPTPDGWTTMGAVKVGDELFGADGHPCRVTVKSATHWRDCFRVTFDDASSVICDGDHLWQTTTGYSGGGYRTAVLTARQMAGQLRNPVTGQRHQRVSLAAALSLPERDLPIHPYVLGCWLGDGHHASGVISKPDPELWENIKSCGYSAGKEYGATDGARTVFGLVGALRTAGVLGNKHIPDSYLRASAEQRLALLQGIMDTDGSWNRPRKRAVLTTVNKAFAEQVHELVVSLGWRAAILPHTARGFGLTIEAYYVEFTPVRLNPFRLSRKASLVRLEGTAMSRRRLVVSVEPVPTVPTACVQVDSPDSLYLCGPQMVPTHNTKDDAGAIAGVRKNGPRPAQVAQLQLGMAAAREAGIDVDRAALLFLPRSGDDIDSAYVWGPIGYDEQAAIDAAAWSADVDTLAADPDTDPRDHRGKPAFWCYSYCPWARACRGEPLPEPVLDAGVEAVAAQFHDADLTVKAGQAEMRELRPELLGLSGQAGAYKISTTGGNAKTSERPDVDALIGWWKFANPGVPLPVVTEETVTSQRLTVKPVRKAAAA